VRLKHDQMVAAGRTPSLAAVSRAFKRSPVRMVAVEEAGQQVAKGEAGEDAPRDQPPALAGIGESAERLQPVRVICGSRAS